MQIQINEEKKELKLHGKAQFPILISDEKLSNYTSGAFIWHWHPEIEITLIVEGEILYRIQDKTYLLTKGNILFGNVNTVHTGKMKEEKDCKYISITFHPRLIYGFKDSLIYTKYVQPIIFNRALSSLYFAENTKNYDRLFSLVQELISCYRKKEEFAELKITHLLQEIWKIIYEKKDQVADTLINPKEYERMDEMIAYVHHHYKDPITLEEIAREIHLCKGECSKLFKKCMKISLFSYLQEYRIERSVEFLLDPDYLIADVAEEVGFSSANYYIKVFKKYKGCSPLKYRKMMEL